MADTDTLISPSPLSGEFLAVFKKKGVALQKEKEVFDLGTLPARIKALMTSLADTNQSINAGISEFSSYQHLDDIVLSGGLKQSAKVKLLDGISSTIALIQSSRKKLLSEAKLLQAEAQKSPNPAELLKGIPGEDVYRHCLNTVNAWYTDVPDGIRNELPLIKDRVKALSGTAAERTQIKDDAKQKIALLKHDVDEFKNVIAAHSSRSFERTDPFATRMLTSLTLEEQKAIYPVWERLASAGQQFLDASMSLDKLGENGERGDQASTRYDFQALYKEIEATGLPQAWWPPRLVGQVQAWRKASRIHNAEKSKKPKPKWQELGGEALGALGQLAQLGGLAGSIAAFDTTFDPETLPGAPIEPDKSAERFTMMVAAICTLTSGMSENAISVVNGGAKEKLKEMLTFDETIDLSQRADQLLSLLEKSGDAASMVMDLMANVEKVKGTELGKLLDGSVVPGLGLAVHIIKLATVIKAAADSALLTAKTNRLGVTADQQDASGLRQDGGVTTKALGKAVKSQQEFTARKGLEVFTESVQVTAGAVVLSGVSAPAGYGLSVAGTAIQLAGEKVFEGIDWSQAKVAKKLLEQARAGSPTAQQMLFENCELYAKLYLAILVREADPLAQKYIEDRGITQDALDRPTSIWLLGETLRDAVEKEDDTEIDDNLAMHLAGPLGRLGKLTAGLVVEGASAVIEKGRKMAASDYDDGWKPPALVDLLPANWAANKDSAVSAAGLRNDTSGVGDGLKALRACIDEYDTIAATVKGGDQADKQARLKQISRILQQAGVARALLSNFRPVQGKKPSEEHVPMRSVLDAMQSDFSTLVQDYRLRALGAEGIELSAAADGKTAILDISKTAWTPIRNNPACETLWTKTWRAALDTVGLADNDHGVAKCLAAVQKQWIALDALESSSQIVDKKNGAKLYDARKAALDALKAAVDALGLCAKSVSLFPNLTDFVAAARNDMAAQMRAIDDRLCGAKQISFKVGAKPKMPDHNDKSTDKAFKAWAEMWLTSWQEASELGYCTARGGDELSIALHAFGVDYAAHLALPLTEKTRPDPKKRDAALSSGAKVMSKCDALIQKEPYAPDVLLSMAKGYLTDVMNGRMALINEIATAAVLDPNELKALQAALPGQVPAGGKGLIVPNEKLQSAWEKAYVACVTSGVAEKSDSGAALGKQLGAIKKAMEAANAFLATGKCAAKDLDKLYVAMGKVRSEITSAIKLVNKLLAAPGFAANDQIMDLLSVVGAEFGNYLAVINDRKGKIEISTSPKKDSEYPVDAVEFSAVKNSFLKQQLAPSWDTGLSKLIETAAKKDGTKDRGLHNNELSTKVDDVINRLLAEVNASTEAAKKTKPPGEPLDYAAWIGYLRTVKKTIP